MQCSKPLSVYNPKLHFNVGFDKPLLQVPCGHCLSCQHMIQNDWVLRGYFHFLKYTDVLKGAVFFATLTYKDSSLPYYFRNAVVRGKPSSADLGKNDFPCFSHDDIDKFLNSLRQLFLRSFNIKGINYFVGCEYGSNGTHRPHYHIILFIPDMWKLSSFGGIHYSKHDSFIKNVISHYWHEVQDNGFVIFSKQEKGGVRVNSHIAIKYVGKYCTKDKDFYNNPRIKNVLLSDTSKECLKRNLPRHWQSKGFGSHFADYILNSSDPYHILSVGYALPIEKDGKRPYFQRVPKYIEDRLFNSKIYQYHYETRLNKRYKFHTYKVTDHIFTQLSNFGYQYKVSTLEKSIYDCVKTLQNDMSLPILTSYLPYRDYIVDLSLNYLNTPIFNVQDLHSHLHALLGSRSLRDLAIYKVVYRGNNLYPGIYINFDDLDNLLDPKVYSFYYASLLAQKRKFDPQTTRPRVVNPRSVVSSCFDSVHSVFHDFETILRVLNYCKCNTSHRISQSNYDKYRISKRLKDKLQKI